MTLTGESQETFGLHWFVIECSQVGMDLVKYTAQQRFSTDFNLMSHFERT